MRQVLRASLKAPSQRWLVAFRTVLWFLVFLWLVHLVNAWMGYRLNHLGVYPRDIHTMETIFFWSFLHGNYQHLVANSASLFVLGFLVALRGWKVFLGATFAIAIIAGFGVWVIGRPAHHIGASGILFGYFSMLVALAFYERQIKTFLIAMFIVFAYGGIIYGVLPVSSYVSWEGHLSGFMAGILVAAIIARPSKSSI